MWLVLAHILSVRLARVEGEENAEYVKLPGQEQEEQNEIAQVLLSRIREGALRSKKESDVPLVRGTTLLRRALTTKEVRQTPIS